jgi:hypothetical protein
MAMQLCIPLRLDCLAICMSVYLCVHICVPLHLLYVVCITSNDSRQLVLPTVS